MTIEELAAQRCADEWNESELSLQYKWKPTNFIESARSQRVQYRLLVERIHHAIEAFEAGDKDALEPFKLVEPVDPLLLEAREIVKEILDPIRHAKCNCRAEIDEGDWDHKNAIRATLVALRRAEIERAERD